MSRDAFNQELLDFLGLATTPFHAVARMCDALSATGFRRLEDDEPWQLASGGKYYLTRNDSSLIAFVHGAAGPVDGLRIIGAHTDSPGLMLKPNPVKNDRGYLRLGVEVYGGALLNPWFDRDLSLAGRVSFEDALGNLRTKLIDFRDPVGVIPSLAIHLDREVNRQRSINPQTDILPLLGLCDKSGKPDLQEVLCERLRQEHPDSGARQVLAFELLFYDTQPPAILGLQREFIASARLDNLLSCFVGLQALLDADGAQSAMLVCNDHEEVGSLSAAGAQGPFLRSVLARLAGSDEGLAALVERSLLVSADNAHGIHPNYPDKHDDNHGPLLNGGPVIKINANQRYATNSETAGFFRMLAQQVDVPVQSFVVRTDMACGSTIGPISAGETGIRTLDVGVPTFAMHSIRELAGTDDGWNLCRILSRFLDVPGPLLPGR